VGLYATLGTLSLRLAKWRMVGERYRDEYRPVDPNLKFLPNDPTALVAEQGVAYWAMREWKAGEGADRWNPESPGFHVSSNVTRKRTGEGLVLGAAQSTAWDSTGAAIFNDGQRFGYGLGKLWTATDANGYSWDVTNAKWSAAIATGGGANNMTSMTDGDDTYIYSGFDNLTIRRWKTGTQASHYATGTGDDFVNDPVLRSFDGTLYALDGDDLYEIDKTVADTRTLKVDVTGSSAVYLAAQPWCFGRMSLSDVGPIWLQRLDNGQTFIWQYNVYQDVGQIVGKLPSDFAFPYSIFFTAGFIFVAYREADAHATAGNAHIYYQRGAQRGVLPLVRSTTGTTASKPILIAGVDGDDLIFYYDAAVWAYNFTDGGLFQLSAATLTGTPQDAITLGASTFITPVTNGANTAAVERFDRLNYTTGVATIESGIYDFTYFDVPKILTTLTVITDPLPANTSVSAAYQVDTGSWVALTGAHDTDGATAYSWTVSTNSSTVRGRNFGIRFTLNTTATASTPTLRGWTARAVTAADNRRILMEVDVSTDDEQDTSVLLTGLRALKAAQNVVLLTLPFEGYEHQAAQSIDVVVRDLILPDAQSPSAQPSAIVVVQAVELVVA